MSRILSEGTVSHSVKSYDRLEWTIDDFFNRNVDTYIESPDLCIGDSIWHMAVTSHGSDTSRDISLNVWRARSTQSRYTIRAGIKRKNGKDGMVIHCETDADGFLEVRKFLPWTEISKNNAKNFPGGHLTIFCEICAVRKDGNVPKVEGPLTSLLIKNLKDLFLGGQHSDAIIKVEDKDFKVHKAILGARCPVFSSMFEHDMKESNSGVVNIPDCSAEAFEAFLLYLYTGKVDGCTSDTVFNLYYVADKYGIQDLKDHCVKFMKNSMSVENFCDVITLSLSHNEKELREVATQYFSENLKVIIKTVKWQTYVKENPIQANELFIKAVDA